MNSIKFENGSFIGDLVLKARLTLESCCSVSLSFNIRTLFLLVKLRLDRYENSEYSCTYNRHENFQEKAGIPAFLVKINVFSFLFMIFWAFLTRFPAFC